MKNLFRENRIVWQENPVGFVKGVVAGGKKLWGDIKGIEADSGAKVEKAPVETTADATTDVSAKTSAETTPEKIAEEKTTSRESLRKEIEKEKKILYKRIIEGFKGQEFSLQEKGKTKENGWLERKVWSMAMSMDTELWKELSIANDAAGSEFDEEDWAKSDSLKLFVESGKRNDIFANMFTAEAFDKLNTAGALNVTEDLMFFKFEYDESDALKVTHRFVKKDSEEYKKIIAGEQDKATAEGATEAAATEAAAGDAAKKDGEAPAKDAEKTPEAPKEVAGEGPNYKAMSEVVLKKGGFMVGLMSMFGIIPSKVEEGEDLRTVQAAAIEKGLKGEDPVLSWIFGVMGINACKGSTGEMDTFMADTPFGDTYLKWKDKVAERGKRPEFAQAVNEAEKVPFVVAVASETVAQKKVLDGIGSSFEYAEEKGVIFNVDEKIKPKFNLQVVIPKGLVSPVKLGEVRDDCSYTENGTVEPLIRGHEIESYAERNRTILFTSGTTIPKGTVFAKGVAYKYVPAEEEAEQATD